MSTLPVATIGNISIDDLVFPDGSTKWCLPGGNAVYSALGAALWTGEIAPHVIAPVGPEYPVADLKGRIDLSSCRKLDRTLRDWGLYEEEGTRIFTFRTKTKNWLEFSPTLDDLGDVSYAAAHIAPLRWELQIDFAKALRARGAAIVSVDPDDRYLDQLDRTQTMALLNAVDLFLPSRQDVEALLPGRTMLEALEELRHMAPDLPIIAIKCGADGVIAHEAGADFYYSLPSVAAEVIDTTGAGDSFCGGMLAGYAATGSSREALLRGSVSASYTVASYGPVALVDSQASDAANRLEDLRGKVSLQPITTSPLRSYKP
ncbi:carbohydrate kinase family protein [Rhizobium johnstonii]|uniref:carbohydrate kinase family protein n=1 Tax=Rhizobium johnstonii TaxID=3019933 RepID=UPI003F95159B